MPNDNFFPFISFNPTALDQREPTLAELQATNAAALWLGVRAARVLHRWNKLADRSWGDPHLLSYRFQDDGQAVLGYRYYSGGNEYDTDTVTVPLAWLQAANPDALILAKLEANRVAEAQAEEEECQHEADEQARQEAASERAQLEHLRTKHPHLFKDLAKDGSR